MINLNQEQVHQAYQQLIEQFNQARLVGDTNRVPLLKRLVAALGHPEQHYQVIHIAGTNGKGSTGAMLGAILEQQGYRVGRFSSPAIINDREQLQVNHQWISKAAFLDGYAEILPVAQRLGLAATDISIFEWQFLICLIWFKNEGVTYAILEAGLGGLTDATNAISAPQLTVFTKIALDHTQILGDTITKIATQKSKIIKPGTVAVTLADQAPDALTVLQQEADQQGVRLVAPTATMTIDQLTPTHMVITGHSDLFDWSQLQLNVTGQFQAQNLALVLTAVAVLRQQHVVLSDDAVRTGLQQIQLPDRLTEVKQTPLTLVDVAHNPDGMRALVSSLTAMVPGQHVIWILGVLADKAVTEMLETLIPTAKQILTVTPANPQRALPATELTKQIQQLAPTLNVQTMSDMPTALASAQQNWTKADIIVVSGSFYVARELAAIGAD